jgi:hypothetical protein
LSGHAGFELSRAALGVDAEVGLTLGFPEGPAADLQVSPHTGVSVESVIFNVFAHQAWLLDSYPIGGGVRYTPIFGIPAAVCIVGRPQRDAQSRRPDAEAAFAPFAHLPARGASTEAHDWLQDATEELASVPAFLQLARELVALGAPTVLVERALAAARDELRHTLLCAQVASDYAAQPRCPVLPQPSARPPLRGRRGLLRLALESWLDGCLGEGLAACLAADAAEHEKRLLARAVQWTIARDEQRHAELAWHILAWCIDQDREVAGALRLARHAEVLPPVRLAGDAKRRKRVAARQRLRADQRMRTLL